MTEQERREGFMKAVADAEQRYGMTFVAYIEERTYQHGDVKRGAGLDLALIEGWMPPADPEPPK